MRLLRPRWELPTAALLALASCQGDASHLDVPDHGVAESSHRLSVTAQLTSSIPANPFIGALLYVNPDYTHSATLSSAQMAVGSTDAQAIAQVAQLPTAVWLDRTEAIAGGAANAGRMSLTDHLDAALAQGAQAGLPPVLLLVVYNLPDRDCAAAASNGELHGSAGLTAYKQSYIAGIQAALTASPRYHDVRVAIVLEPDSLPNLITNTHLPSCAEASQNNLYRDGITYAIQTLGALSNVSIYLDIAHSGWLGWPNNMQQAVALYTELIQTAQAGRRQAVRGFATDIANYTPLREPFIGPTDAALLQGDFYQFNPVFDELTYISTLSSQFEAAGLHGFGFIIDTSRNGWRPVADGQPIDRRHQRGNWCNVLGAGLGERPRAVPGLHPQLDAFVYVKPPGESDGSSSQGGQGGGPDAAGKRFDLHCDATNPSLDAMPNAPSAGTWFPDQLLMLVRNAHPALSSEPAPTPTPTPPTPFPKPQPAPVPAPLPKPQPAPVPAPRPKPQPAPVPAPAPQPKPHPAPGTCPAPVPGATQPQSGAVGCTVHARLQSSWPVAGGTSGMLELQIVNSGSQLLTAPWTVVLQHGTYTGASQPYSWQLDAVVPGRIVGHTTDASASLAPGASVTVGLQVTSSSHGLLPSTVTVADKLCKIYLTK